MPNHKVRKKAKLRNPQKKKYIPTVKHSNSVNELIRIIPEYIIPLLTHADISQLMQVSQETKGTIELTSYGQILKAINQKNNLSNIKKSKLYDCRVTVANYTPELIEFNNPEVLQYYLIAYLSLIQSMIMDHHIRTNIMPTGYFAPGKHIDYIDEPITNILLFIINFINDIPSHTCMQTIGGFIVSVLPQLIIYYFNTPIDFPHTTNDNKIIFGGMLGALCGFFESTNQEDKVKLIAVVTIASMGLFANKSSIKLEMEPVKFAEKSDIAKLDAEKRAYIERTLVKPAST